MVGRGARGVGAAVVGCEYHAAALAIMLGHFEQVGQRLAGHGGNEFHHVDARCDLATLPTADGLACDEELGGELLLGKVMGATDGNELFCKGHSGSFLLVDGLSIRGGRRLPSNRWLHDGDRGEELRATPHTSMPYNDRHGTYRTHTYRPAAEVRHSAQQLFGASSAGTHRL